MMVARLQTSRRFYSLCQLPRLRYTTEPAPTSLQRDYSTAPWRACPLPDRALLRVAGSEAGEFLQGLMTNDVTRIGEEGRLSIYSMFLNTRGRILFDSLVSKGFENEEYFLEVDKAIAETARKHLAMYKVRRKIKIENLDKKFSLYAAFRDVDVLEQQPPLNYTTETPPENTTRAPVIGSTYCGYGSHPTLQDNLPPPNDSSALVFPDPRLASLGYRLVVPADNPAPLSHLPPHSQLACSSLYLSHRCQLGVAEGTADIPVDKCFPMEYNADYLDGVSFHKGCYIGQELTARTHHTGVVRKRILPLRITGGDNQEFELESAIINTKGKTVGKLRCLHGDVGLGLMRLAESAADKDLSVGGAKVEVWRPAWWPEVQDVSGQMTKTK